MINFHMGLFWNGLEIIQQDIRRTGFVVASGHGNERIPHNEVVTLKNNADFVIKECAAKIAQRETNQACVELEAILDLPEAMVTYHDVHDRLEKLLSVIEYWTKQEYFHHYPQEMAKLIHPSSIEKDWSDVLTAFPTSRREIEAGLDCFALDDYSGSVFHMVRISELGLRTIAGERGVTTVGKDKPIEWGMWGDVFRAIDSKMEEIRNKPAGPKKDAADIFYRGALSDLRFLQTYRDPTMHFREDYGKGEAHDAMYRVKALMKRLSTKLAEGNTTPIDWGL